VGCLKCKKKNTKKRIVKKQNELRTPHIDLWSIEENNANTSFRTHALNNLFCFFPGIGPKTESKLKSLGFKNWDDILQKKWPGREIPIFFKKLQKNIQETLAALQEKDILSISKKINRKYHWLLIPHLIDDFAYLDIETTGLEKNFNDITTIAVYYQNQFYNFIYNENFCDFPDFIHQISAIVTFYGLGFDLPFLKTKFNMDFPQLHLDLCFLLQKVGLRGGLKKIERKIGLRRGDVAELDGRDAVKLWDQYNTTGDRIYLETLIAYNNWDVFNLPFLLRFVYNELLNLYGLTGKILPKPNIENTSRWKVNPQVVEELKRNNLNPDNS
jgi:uncharacterized protein YprB with RNaseH-like and TPR domain